MPIIWMIVVAPPIRKLWPASKLSENKERVFESPRVTSWVFDVFKIDIVLGHCTYGTSLQNPRSTFLWTRLRMRELSPSLSQFHYRQSCLLFLALQLCLRIVCVPSSSELSCRSSDKLACSFGTSFLHPQLHSCDSASAPRFSFMSANEGTSSVLAASAVWNDSGREARGKNKHHLFVLDLQGLQGSRIFLATLSNVHSLILRLVHPGQTEQSLPEFVARLAFKVICEQVPDSYWIFRLPPYEIVQFRENNHGQRFVAASFKRLQSCDCLQRVPFLSLSHPEIVSYQGHSKLQLPSRRVCAVQF